MSAGSRVLAGWYLDMDYRDAKGRPLRLAFEGDSPSFEALVRRYAADAPSLTLFKELSAAGAVEIDPDGMLRVVKRSYIPRPFDANQIKLWGSVMHDIGSTLSHNMRRAGSIPPRFERRAINRQVRRSAVAEFRHFLEKEGQMFLEKVDLWLTEHVGRESANGGADAAPGEARMEGPVRVGVGVYMIDDAPPRAASGAKERTP